MDRAGYLTVLKARAAASSRPVLSDAEVEAILDLYPVVDADGRTADDADWTEGWDLNAAAAEAWRQKAAKVAGDFSFSADNASYSKADVMAHCLEMAAEWAGKSNGVMVTLNPGAGVPYYDRDGAWDGAQIP